MTNKRLVLTTTESMGQARRIADALIERKLAACVNILPGMVSHYWWGGKIERADEVVMFIKTRASMSEAVRGAVKELHTYTTPAFMVLPVENLDSAYHAWIVGETAR